jgi:ABC-type Fe3+-siderophore transport system permease subunit
MFYVASSFLAACSHAFRAIDTAYCGNGAQYAGRRKTVPASVIVDALTGTCQSADCTIIRDARLPRTLAGLLAGGALGLAGALMQTLTRNPLADPGLLGVNAGASFAIVLGAALFGAASPLNNWRWPLVARWLLR